MNFNENTRLLNMYILCKLIIMQYTGSLKKTLKTIENDLLLEFQCLAVI